MRNHFLLPLAFCLAVLVPGRRRAAAEFDLQVSATGFSRSQREAFLAAEEFWESIILGYAPGITQTSLTFSARKRGLDGQGGILGQAGPTGSLTQGGFVISTGGTMLIDSADIDLLTGDGQLADVVAHEIGHILGIGTLWIDNGLYHNNSGRYTGTNGLQAYQAEFDSGASFIPVELDGGAGTANGHWDELNNVFDTEGRPLSEELMTGFLGSDPYLSQTTIQSLRDLGFEVVGPPAVLLPNDYNDNGAIDAADYTVWRDNLGAAAGALANDPTGLPIGQAQYDAWKASFGNTASATVSVRNTVVPEPTTWRLLLVAAAGTSRKRRR